MNKNNCQNVSNYLTRFDEILCEMANKMLSQPTTNSITVNFITCMIPHHQAAIYMCENLLKYTNYPPLIQIANNIIKTQTEGIEQMKRILETTQGYINSNKDVCSYMNEYLRITKNMITRMKNSPRCNNINLDFTNEMIPHHEGAIAMCKNLLKYCIDPRLKCVAENIISEQSQGVEQLKQIKMNLCKSNETGW